MPDLQKLETRIGYTFINEQLLSQALTHRSYSKRNNERLEFLGDAILNFVIASVLFEKFVDSDEGDLSRLRAGLVKQETLADLARELDLGPFLTMGIGELKSGGFKRDSILSDALEAIFGAVLLDSDMATAARIIKSLFESRSSALSVADIGKDAKSLLQEFLQGNGEPVPEYILLRTIGKSPHQEFEVECRCGQLKKLVVAAGSSRRKAEQNAAALALDEFGVSS